MLVKNLIRGNSIIFSSEFLDANNNVVAANQAAITLYYKSNNQYVTVSANMVSSGNTWSYSWDSSNADVGMLEWHIQASNANGSIASDGELRIYANKANITVAGVSPGAT